jgi:hypothetical protein
MVTLATVRASFTEQVPTMERMARRHFLHLNPEARQEAVTNTLALAWMFLYRLFRQGRAEKPEIVRSCLWYAIRQTKVGRTPQGCPKKKDTLSPRWVGPTRSAGFDPDQFVSRNTAVPDAVIFKVDVPQFMSTLNDRQRQMAVDLAVGMTTSEAAKKHKLSAGRISQFRKEFKAKFDQFFGE